MINQIQRHLTAFFSFLLFQFLIVLDKMVPMQMLSLDPSMGLVGAMKFAAPQGSSIPVITAERQRKLQQLTFTPSVILSRDLPRDTVLKHLLLRLSGSIVTTFASGTPVADAFSTFDNLVSRIDVIVNGSRTVKNQKPFLLIMQQLYTSLIRAERCASAGATAVADNYPVTDGGFTYGTTGQITTVRESVLVSFENVYARTGKESTWLNLKGVASAEVRLTCNAYAALLGFANTAPVVFTSSTFVIDILTIEAQEIPPEVVFSDWKQTTKQISFSAQSTAFAIDINRGNKIQGLMMLTRNGAAGSTTTATGKLASSLVVTNWNLSMNGQTIIKAGDFKALQAENRMRFGLSAPFASSVCALDGVGYIDLLSDDGRGDLNSALDARPPLVDNLQLYVDTNNSTNTDYTNPVTLDLETQEIVTPNQ